MTIQDLPPRYSNPIADNTDKQYWSTSKRSFIGAIVQDKGFNN